MPNNLLFCGDNLDILRDYIADESVDLVYLDPPFKSDQNYNVLFKEKTGAKSSSQILAFEDTWEWNLEAEKNFLAVKDTPGKLGEVMEQFRVLLGETDMLAYLSMMAPRLVELRRVLKPSGSMYLHCDPTASHYLKILMDSIFSPQNFVNEIIWKRSSAHSDARQGARHFGRVSDTILFYCKSEEHTWNSQYVPYDPAYIERDYRRVDADGRRYRIGDLSGPGGAAKGNPAYEVMGVTRHWRYSRKKMEQLIREGRVIQTRPGAVPQYKRYLDEMPGVPVQNIWTDVPVINNRSREKLGYPTQKPQALLERIIQASSKEGDIVLDPFCGCGTAVEAADKMHRRWIGIDITEIAIDVIRKRLDTAGVSSNSYRLVIEPRTLSAAEALARADKYQFQEWIVRKLGGTSTRRGGGDRGVDGRLWFKGDPASALRPIIVSVKGGDRITPAFVRELQGAVDAQRAPMGILVTLREPSKQMLRDVACGFYSSVTGNYPKTQIITVEDILSGKPLALPPIERIGRIGKPAAAAAWGAGQMQLPGVG